jgi:fibronectin type 3 domain-containing protein
MATGYNVYRSTQSGSGYTLLTSSPISTMTYTDTSVTAGSTYYYVTTAVDAHGDQSTYSTQVTAVVPAS